MTTVALELRTPTPARARPALADVFADPRALARAFAAGDAAAREHVCRTCLGPVYGYLLARLGDRAEADDAVQETFLAALATASR
ncbi:MAG TPA: sigma factor, partial [Planctomycetota bacterium]|nr:sigma factor [Planctomycetota bacterium]